MARIVIAGFCAIGLYGVAPIVYRHATGIETCPTLGPVPACNVVLLGYTVMGVSVFAVSRIRTPLFLAGWIPVFGLALTGSSMEILGYQACPRSGNGIPACYFSLAFASGLMVLFIVERINRPKPS
jgi:hypothetical protein